MEVGVRTFVMKHEHVQVCMRVAPEEGERFVATKGLSQKHGDVK